MLNPNPLFEGRPIPPISSPEDGSSPAEKQKTKEIDEKIKKAASPLQDTPPSPMPEDLKELKARLDRTKPINPELTKKEMTASTKRLLLDLGCFCNDREDAAQKLKEMKRVPFLVWESKTSPGKYGIYYPNSGGPLLISEEQFHLLTDECKKKFGQEVLYSLAILREKGHLCENEKKGREKLGQTAGFPFVMWPSEKYPGCYNTISKIASEIYQLPRFAQKYFPRSHDEARGVGTLKPIDPEIAKKEMIASTKRMLLDLGCFCNNREDATQRLQELKSLPLLVWESKQGGYGIYLRDSDTPLRIYEEQLLSLTDECKKVLGKEVFDSLVILREEGCLCENEEKGRAHLSKETTTFPFVLWPSEKYPGCYNMIARISSEITQLPQFLQDLPEAPQKPVSKPLLPPVRKDPAELKAKLEKSKPINPEVTQKEKIASSIQLLRDIGHWCDGPKEAGFKLRDNKGGLPFFVYPLETIPITYKCIRPSVGPEIMNEDGVINLAENRKKIFGNEIFDSLSILRDRGCICKNEKEGRDKLISNPKIPLCMWPSKEEPGEFQVLIRGETKIQTKHILDIPNLIIDELL